MPNADSIDLLSIGVLFMVVLIGITVAGTVLAIKPRLLLAIPAGIGAAALAGIVTGGNLIGVVVLLVAAVVIAIVVGLRKELRRR